MEPTRALPVLERNREPTMSAESATIASPPLGRISAVPLWMRLLLWIVAVPLSFFVVFGIARAFGWFTTNQLSDVFLANDAGRFWPVVRLLPFVALLTAFVVHGGVLLIARRRVH
jgi:hypothetical protein